MHLTVANKLYSSWSMRPWMMLHAIGQPFTETTIPLRQADTVHRITATSASAKLPVLNDGGTIIWESLAIIEYLAEKFPHAGVWPRDSQARAHARCISNEMHAGFQPLRQACPMNFAKQFKFKLYAPDVHTNVERIQTTWREARTLYGAKSGSGPFLYGAFSAADAMYAPVVARLDGYSWHVMPDTRAYMNAIMAHPSYVKWRDDSLSEPSSWDLAVYDEGQTIANAYDRPHAPKA